jgi:hypothetical protein
VELPAVQSYRVTVGPIDSPQARLRIEQPQGKTFKGLSVKFGRKDIEITRALSDQEIEVVFLMNSHSP